MIHKNFKIVGMTCTACSQSISSYLKALNGIVKAEVSLSLNQLSLSYNEEVISFDDILDGIRKMGYDLIDSENKEFFEAQNAQYSKSLFKKFIVACVCATPIFIYAMFFMGTWSDAKYLMLILSLPVIFYSGSHFYINAFKLIRFGKSSMDTLVALSTGLAFLFSVFNTFFPNYYSENGLPAPLYYESAVVIITLILLGKFLEEKAKQKTTQAIRSLAALKNPMVNVERNGAWAFEHVSKINKGDLISIAPGQEIPLDGKVKRGSSYVNESAISGESISVLKEKKDKVLAGSINESGQLKVLVSANEKDSFLAQMVTMVEKALATRAPIEVLTDKISAYFVPIVVLIALFSMVLWYFFYQDLSFSIWIGVTILIVACPCALGLATPTAISVGMGKAAENGILIKNAEVLEHAKNVDVVILDKTGTLTAGKPSLLNYESTISFPFHSLFSNSYHPLSQALANADIQSIEEGESFKHINEVFGKGVSFEWKNESFYYGSYAYLMDSKCVIPSTLSQEAEYRNKGNSMVYFFNDRELLAYFVLHDQLKPEAEAFIRALQHKNIEVELWSGDLYPAVSSCAKALNIRNFNASSLPQDKMKRIKVLQEEGKIVAMIGDGSNDAPALAMADVSVAMAKGTDIAMNSAQITLVRPDLNIFIKALEIARSTQKTIKQNLFWAFIYNLLMLPIAAGVLYPINGYLLNPMLAGLAMSLSSISVLLNSLKLRLL